MIIERKDSYHFDELQLQLGNLTNYSPEDIRGFLKASVEIRQRYHAAMKEISTKLEILDEAFALHHSYNPIHHMECRIKRPQSVIAKMKRKDIPLGLDSIIEHISDIAGIRVVCCYLHDIYKVSELLEQQRDITLLRRTDYVECPKPNGYRSLHLVVSVPVFLTDSVFEVPVEIQMRTIAMDVWASLEHHLTYKATEDLQADVKQELLDCAQDIAKIDMRMPDILKKTNRSVNQ